MMQILNFFSLTLPALLVLKLAFMQHFSIIKLSLIFFDIYIDFKGHVNLMHLLHLYFVTKKISLGTILDMKNIKLIVCMCVCMCVYIYAYVSVCLFI